MSVHSLCVVVCTDTLSPACHCLCVQCVCVCVSVCRDGVFAVWGWLQPVCALTVCDGHVQCAHERVFAVCICTVVVWVCL